MGRNRCSVPAFCSAIDSLLPPQQSSIHTANWLQTRPLVTRCPASRRGQEPRTARRGLNYPARHHHINLSRLAPSQALSSAPASLISRHLNTTRYPPVNRPNTIERSYSSHDDLPHTSLIRSQSRRSLSTSTKMPAQEPHPSLLIPGPIEISDDVAQSMSHFAQSHVGPPFTKVFGETLAQLRELFQTKNPSSQPFIIAGSGTLGWDLAAANLTEPGDEVLVLHTGYFANSFTDCFETYGVKATQLKAAIGDRPQLPEIEKALKEKTYKAITVTHVDTSTGVLSQIQPLSDLLQKVSPSTLLIVDGVCSVGGEQLHFDDMRIDFALTASQKAIGAPPGLSISMASERAVKTFESRKSPPGSYYASWKNWMPVMQKYESGNPLYFATQPTQLIQALHTSLTAVLKNSLDQRFKQHQKVSDKVKKAVSDMGLKQLATDPSNAANTMTAIYLPDGLVPTDVLPLLMKKNIVFAGGLHKEIATKYIRFGHMGVSATDESRGDIDKAIEALKESLAEAKKSKGQ